MREIGSVPADLIRPRAEVSGGVGVGKVRADRRCEEQRELGSEVRPCGTGVGEA